MRRHSSACSGPASSGRPGGPDEHGRTATGQARFFLPALEDTLALGRALAEGLPTGWKTPTLLLRAGLGSGKTTLTRGFVSALPGAELAEVASPSFNLANIYPTAPPVMHVDLYRLGEGCLDAGLEELLDNGAGAGERVLIVEWAQHLPPDLAWPDRLEMSLEHMTAPSRAEPGREAHIAAYGPHAALWLKRIVATFSRNVAS